MRGPRHPENGATLPSGGDGAGDGTLLMASILQAIWENIEFRSLREFFQQSFTTLFPGGGEGYVNGS